LIAAILLLLRDANESVTEKLLSSLRLSW
jgi:hypothetical protein